jgi:hypothetical protein
LGNGEPARQKLVSICADGMTLESPLSGLN